VSKKRRRKRDRRPNIPQQTLRTTSGATGVQQKRVQPSSQEFNPDYSHVYRDLKRIGTLAGFFVVVLIILSFVLR
jgi:hypothetical protein